MGEYADIELNVQVLKPDELANALKKTESIFSFKNNTFQINNSFKIYPNFAGNREEQFQKKILKAFEGNVLGTLIYCSQDDYRHQLVMEFRKEDSRIASITSEGINADRMGGEECTKEEFDSVPHIQNTIYLSVSAGSEEDYLGDFAYFYSKNQFGESIPISIELRMQVIDGVVFKYYKVKEKEIKYYKQTFLVV